MPHGITQCYLPPGRGDIPALTSGRLKDVSYISFDVQKDDSYTGRGRVERRRRDLGLRRCDRVAVE